MCEVGPYPLNRVQEKEEVDPPSYSQVFTAEHRGRSHLDLDKVSDVMSTTKFLKPDLFDFHSFNIVPPNFGNLL